MGNIDNYEFEKRGARGCSNSDYYLCRTTCCGAWCVEDTELSDLYTDGTDPSAVLSLLVVNPADILPCPFCRSETWDFRPVDDPKNVPEEWRWALSR
jgi:hypothetical protein